MAIGILSRARRASRAEHVLAGGDYVSVARIQPPAKTRGKIDRTIAIVVNSVTYLENFLNSEGLPADVALIGPNEFRAFILHLQQKRCFSDHPWTNVQDRGLSGHTINCYLRSVRAFWSWLVAEEIVATNPFTRLKIPRAPSKVIPTFSDLQLKNLVGVIEDVPALVCNRCGDTLIPEESIAAIDDLLKNEVEPQEYAPVYRFPTKVA